MARKGNDMTAMIRFYNVNSKRRDAQVWAKELCVDLVRPFHGKSGRIDCVRGSGWD